MTRLWAALLCAALACGGLAGTALAQQNNLFEVRGVPVRATASTPSEARDIAIRSGLSDAWTAMFRRLTAQSEWAKQPALTPEQVAGMIVAFNPVNEGTSATQYQALVTYTFKPGEVRKALRSAGASWSETRGRPILILPLMNGELFGGDNPWRDLWASGRYGGGLQPVIVPLGGVEDMAAVNAQSAANATWPQVEAMAQRYDAGEVLFAQALPAGGGVALNLVRIGPRGNAAEQFNVTGDLAAAAAQVEAWLEESWKRASAVDYSSRASITALARFNGLMEWSGLRKRLSEVNNVARLGYGAVTTNGAMVEIVYVGRLEQLLGALERAGLMLVRDKDVVVLMAYDPGLIEQLKTLNLYAEGQIPMLPEAVPGADGTMPAGTGPVVTPLMPSGPVPDPVTP